MKKNVNFFEILIFAFFLFWDKPKKQQKI